MAKPTLYSDNSKSANFMETLQAVMLNRMAKPYGGDEPVVYEFTQDRAMLHQYFQLRERMYRKVFGTELFNGQEDVQDKLGYILIARRGNLCLGGCRLTIREADEMWQLPMESDGFVLRDKFSHLPLDKARHGEISRFAIMEDTGNDENIFYGLCKVMHDKVLNEKIHYLFAKSTLILARNWRLIANSFGVKTTWICTDIEVPENPIHPDVKWFITMSNLTSFLPKEVAETARQPVPDLNLPQNAPHLTLVE